MIKNSRIYNLSPFSELRIITEDHYSDGTSTQLQLLKTQSPNASKPYETCTAEIFGRELVPDVKISLGPNERLAVYTWTGCSLQVDGVVRQEYEAFDHSMKEYLNVTSALDAERELAAIVRNRGPRVIVTGAPSSGKSSICMILCNYAVRNGWTPVYIDTDPRCSTDKKALQLFPGTIGATVIGDVNDVSPKNPLTFFYGHGDILENERLYLHLCKCLSASIELMIEMNLKLQPSNRQPDVTDLGKHIAASGTIINAPYQASSDLVKKLAEIFDVSMILVVDSPSIHQDLVRVFNNNKANYQTIGNTSRSNSESLTPRDLTKPVFEEQQADFIAEGNNTESNRQKLEKGNTIKDVVVLGITKLEGVVPVDQNRLKYLNNIAWKQYFERTSLGEFHVIRFNYSNVKLLVLQNTIALTGDALPRDDKSSMKTEELYATKWIGDPRSLINVVLAIPSTDDIHLIPYTNIIGFFHVRKVEEIPQISENEEETDSAISNIVMLEVACHTIYTPTSVPKSLIVPGNSKYMKWLN
ncbi:bifunctional P-loop containing nucleoside triphosphate hydrolase/Clp1 [Babesia duncani]|uniref:Bifunctional P-loop containing nucleoside triphosphate hydrolase/Clp1 n=1 Tax=Babesia duncani TaxID=323732 RepID=A0AAD9PL15_9APIC|nr:bifunctional P-loop containing nucleoside triphosphate hydrolase/Clp1 [Babesia duncani]